MRKEIDGLQIGVRIKEARVEAGMTQDALAATSGLSRAGIQKYEAGQPPKSLQLAALCQALGVSADYLLFGGPVPATAPTAEGELNKEILVEVMEATFEALERRRLFLPADKLTELIFLLYDHCQADEQWRDKGTVERFLRLAS